MRDGLRGKLFEKAELLLRVISPVIGFKLFP